MQEAESNFNYYNQSARPSMGHLRDLIEKWVAEYPECERKELRARLRCPDNQIFEAAFVEIQIHAYLTRLGYSVTSHPDLNKNKNHPDFLVRNQDGNDLFFLEVTTINDSTEAVAHDRREAGAINQLNQVNIAPDLRIGYSLRHASTGTPSARRLKIAVKRWADDNANAARHGETPRKIFEVDGWKFDLTLHAGFKSNPESRAIAARNMRIRHITPEADLLSALSLKSSRYGKPALPFIIAVADRKDTLAHGETGVLEAMDEALMGEIHLEEVMHIDGKVTTRHVRGNGFWKQNGNPKNRHISGVLVLPDAGVWKLREKKWQPYFSINPWASIAVPDNSIPLPTLIYDDNGRGSTKEGIPFADTLGLPAPWPP
jgi:hypothetical protein